MSPQMRRFAPFIFILLLLFILLPLLNRHSKKGLSGKAKAARTEHALNLIDAGEQTYLAAHRRYSSHLADLIPLTKGLAADLTIVGVQLDVSSDGQTYVAQVASDIVSLVKGRRGTKVVASSCLVLKDTSGVACAGEKTKKR